MFNKQNLIIFIFLVIVLVVVLGYIFKKEEYIGEPIVQTPPAYLPNERGEVISKPDNESIVEPGPAVGTRQDIMNYVFQNIDALAPEPPSSGRIWEAFRFWFADDKNFYIEYGDGKNWRRILLSQKDSTQFELVGYFEPGENDWNIISGQDPFFGKPLDLYEFNEILGEWVKKN